MFSVICLKLFFFVYVRSMLHLSSSEVLRIKRWRTFFKDGDFSVSQMGTDQRDERWWVEETCLIKMKRWNDSLMHVPDAVYVTQLLHMIFV